MRRLKANMEGTVQFTSVEVIISANEEDITAFSEDLDDKEVDDIDSKEGMEAIYEILRDIGIKDEDVADVSVDDGQVIVYLNNTMFEGTDFPVYASAYIYYDEM